MPQPDNVKALYNELKNTYELGSEEDFIKYLSDDKNREALRKELVPLSALTLASVPAKQRMSSIWLSATGNQPQPHRPLPSISR